MVNCSIQLNQTQYGGVEAKVMGNNIEEEPGSVSDQKLSKHHRESTLDNSRNCIFAYFYMFLNFKKKVKEEFLYPTREFRI